MVEWHYQLLGHEFEQTSGDSQGQGNLVCCVHGITTSPAWFSNWTTIISLYSSFNIWTSSRTVSVNIFLPINGPIIFHVSKIFIKSDHFEYYNVETLEIKFSPFSWAVMCCFVIFWCLFVWWIFCINLVKSVIFIECVHWRICSISLMSASDLTDNFIVL